MRIVVIDSDPVWAGEIRRVLDRERYVVDVLADSTSARHVLFRESFDLAILELETPGLGGFSALRRTRRLGCSAPLLVLSARDGVEHRVRALDAGADDYLTKPVHLDELGARVRALLRRRLGAADPEVSFGPLALDTHWHRATLNGKVLKLRRRELCLLEILLANAGKVVSMERIAESLFGYECTGSPNAIQIYVHRLRKKLVPAGISIVTVRGLGYLLEKQSSPEPVEDVYSVPPRQVSHA